MKDYIFYDLEVLMNVFLGVFKHEDKFYVFEVSPWKDDRVALKQFLRNSKNKTLVGFNNMDYDWPIIDYILVELLRKNYTTDVFTTKLCKYSNELINSNYKGWSDPFIRNLDLFRLNHFNNKARMTSLKMLENNMQMENVRDLPYVNVSISREQNDELIEYCKHDVNATEKFFHHCYSKVLFRVRMTEMYGIDFTNTNDVDIGSEILLKALSEEMDMDPNEIRTLRTYRDSMPVKDIIHDKVMFNSEPFSRLLHWWKQKTITETKGQFSNIPIEEVREILPFTNGKLAKKGTVLSKLNIVYKNLQYDFGSGGLHAAVGNGIWEAQGNHMLVLVDVSSYYPNLSIHLGIFPEHLTEKCYINTVENMYDTRMKAKKIGDNESVAGIKLALNGSYGRSNSEFSFMYDPMYTMKICLNGQLLLAMLSEQIADAGIMIPQVNTDGILCYFNKDKWEKLQEICNNWMSYTGLKLDYDHFQKVVQRDVNNYIGVFTNGKIKRKGVFDWKYADNGDWHKNFSQLVVYKAVEEYFLKGIPVEDTLLNEKNIHMFTKRVKVQKRHKLSLGSKIYTCRVFRYIVSKEGETLIKIMPPNSRSKWLVRESNVEKGYLCKECLDINSITFDDIDYNYYLNEANKIIKAVKKQK